MYTNLPWWDGEGTVNILDVPGLDDSGKKDQQILDEIHD